MLMILAGKRKVSDADVAESPRDRKKAREESQPMDEDEGMVHINSPVDH